jgi:hypothetical protein
LNSLRLRMCQPEQNCWSDYKNHPSQLLGQKWTSTLS